MANDYTALTSVTATDRAIELAKSAFPDIDWDDKLNPDRWFLEHLGFISGRVGFYQQNNALNSRWGTAVDRRAQIAAAKLVQVPLLGAKAARTTVTFSIGNATAGDVVIAAETAPRTEEVTDPLAFALLAVATIPAGQMSVSGICEHSEAREEIVASTSRPNQTVVLPRTPYLEGKTTIVAANGTFTEVDSFAESTSTDRHFTVTVDNLDRATIRFGNGAAGAIPSGTITVTYRTGGGRAGNVPAGALKVLDGTFTDTLGNPVTISVTNAAKAEGGDDRESVAAARERVPRAARTKKVAVAREDYQDGALNVTGVVRALALTRDEEPSVAENQLRIYVVPDGGGAPSTQLKTAVLAQFKQQTGYPEPPTRCFQNLDLRVQTPLYPTINVKAKLYFKPGVTTTVGGAAVRAALRDYFAPMIKASRLRELAPNVAAAKNVLASDGAALITNPLVDFGYNLQDAAGEPLGSYPFSDIYNLIRDVPQVARIAGDSEGLLLNGLMEDVAIDAWAFPVLGDVVIVDAKTGTVV